MHVYVCSAGLKGAIFISGLVQRGLPIAKVFTYDQVGDLSRSFQNIITSCDSRSIPVVKTRRPSAIEFRGADLIFVVGWQYLLPLDTRLVVFHDSLLPRYRGFSPTVTALIAGDDVVGVTAFHPAAGIDSGPILAQAELRVCPPARIDGVLTRQAELMVELAVKLVDAKTTGDLIARAQDESLASYSHWRDAEDYFIDWSWPADKIQRFVYALGYPYEGARTQLGNQLATIADCEVVDKDLVFAIRQPGKVWRLTDRGPIVVCGAGLLHILRIQTLTGTEIRLTKLRTRFASSDRAG